MRNLNWGWIRRTVEKAATSRNSAAEIAGHTAHSIQVEAIHQNVEQRFCEPIRNAQACEASSVPLALLVKRWQLG